MRRRLFSLCIGACVALVVAACMFLRNPSGGNLRFCDGRGRVLCTSGSV